MKDFSRVKSWKNINRILFPLIRFQVNLNFRFIKTSKIILRSFCGIDSKLVMFLNF